MADGDCQRNRFRGPVVDFEAAACKGDDSRAIDVGGEGADCTDGYSGEEGARVIDLEVNTDRVTNVLP